MHLQCRKISFNFQERSEKQKRTLQVCWQCRATKGSTSLDMAYTNVGPLAGWRSTCWTSCPWPADEQPSLSYLRGFELQMISADILHVWHLGSGRDLIGSCMVLLVKHRYFSGNNIEQCLARATQRLKTYCKSQKLTVTLKKFTKQNLSWTSDCYPELKAKGYDTAVILSWLNSEMVLHPPVAKPQAYGDQRTLDDLQLCLWASDSLMRMCMSAPQFFDETHQRHKVAVGTLFMNTYVGLAGKAVQAGVRLWRIRPKLHILHHVILEDRPSRQNPHFHSTWMDEDWIKRTMRITRATHKRSAPLVSLQRWLLGLQVKLEEVANHL